MSTTVYHPPTNTLCFDACPPPEVARALKCCENCPIWFSRPLGSTQKYCANCVARMLMPPKIEERILIEEMGYGQRIHYDDSLLPEKEQMENGFTRAREQKKLWVGRVVKLFLQKEMVTAAEIKEASGLKGLAAFSVSECRRAGLCIERVTNTYPARNGRPTQFALYSLRSVDLCQ